MTQKQVNRIRIRDRRIVNKKYEIPYGYQIHHFWYSEEYDESSFIICTPAMHGMYHDVKTINKDVLNGLIDIWEIKKKHTSMYEKDMKKRCHKNGNG